MNKLLIIGVMLVLFVGGMLIYTPETNSIIGSDLTPSQNLAIIENRNPELTPSQNLILKEQVFNKINEDLTYGS